MKHLLLLCALVPLCACSGTAFTRDDNASADAAPAAVHVVDHGWHTGFVVPAADLQARIPLLATRFGAVPFIEIGWGDKEFYRAGDVTLGLALQAILWPTDSVIHAVAVTRDPYRFFAASDIETLCLSKERYSALLDFITSSFERDASGAIQPLDHGLYGDSQFYRGVGKYHLLHTCNTWTAKGLKQAGLALAPRTKLTADSVMQAIRGQEQTPGLPSGEATTTRSEMPAHCR